MHVIKIILVFFAVMNLIGFLLMGIDKLKAKNHQWRIPEAALFLFAVCGGSIGSILGMLLFRHKTRHWYFRYGLPLILLIQVILFAVLKKAPIEFKIL